MRRLLPIILFALVLSACGGSKQAATDGLAGASGKTVSSGSANFTLLINATIAGAPVRSSETGSLSFTENRAHFYKLVPGGGLPQEIVLDGPITYTNANVDKALQDSSVKPWTKLDTTKLPAADAKRHPSELEHVRVLAYLADGVADAKRIGSATVGGEARTHYRGVVDPARVVAQAPAADRAALRNDYPAKPFPADFWLDDAGRVRRVVVKYRTVGGSRIVVDGAFSDFGTKIDLTVPAADEIEDITP